MISPKDDWYVFHRDDLVGGGFKRYSVGDYAERNKFLVRMLRGLEFKTVVEVAGADGDMMSKIFEAYPFIESYNWSDMVAEAVQNVNNKIIDHRLKAVILDLDEGSPEKADLFISTALEHTLRYRDVIEELDVGTLVLLSLPSFNGGGHRIYFPQFTDIINVYGELLDFIRVQVYLSEHRMKNIFVIFIKMCLDKLGLLDLSRKIGIFRSGYDRRSINYRWLLVGRRK